MPGGEPVLGGAGAMFRLRGAKGHDTISAVSYTLMIVDDEQVSREGLARMIDWTSLGFTVVAAYEDGDEAIDHLRSKPVDVVLTDIRMTHASGVDLAEWIRETRPEARVVFMSAYSRFDYARAAIRLGVVHYLVKPLVMGEVDEVFRKIRADLDAESRSSESASHAGRTDAAPQAGCANGMIGRARDFIRTNCARHLSLADVADHVAVSPGYLSRLFSETTGETVSGCIRRARIESAKDLLSASDLNVGEICRAVGYHDVRHFYQIFKESVGLTPTQFRKRSLNAS